MRVSTNTAHAMTRRLAKQFSGNAVGTANPNTFHSNVPSVNDAMGVSDFTAVVSFVHNSGSSRVFTIYYWDAMVNAINAAEGWTELGPNSGIYQQSVDPWAAASFTCPVNVPIFLAADAAIGELLMSGCAPFIGNVNADLAGGGNKQGGWE